MSSEDEFVVEWESEKYRRRAELTAGGSSFTEDLAQARAELVKAREAARVRWPVEEVELAAARGLVRPHGGCGMMRTFIELTLAGAMGGRTACVLASSITAVIEYPGNGRHVVGEGFEFDVVDSLEDILRKIHDAVLWAK